MDVVFLVARILFSLIFLASAMAHFTATDAMTGHAQSKGVPAARPAVLAGGVLLGLGGLSVLLGIWGDLGALFLVVFLVPTALLIHPYWKESESMPRMTEMVNFNKDVGLAGAALGFLVLFSTEAAGLTLTGPLLGLG